MSTYIQPNKKTRRTREERHANILNNINQRNTSSKMRTRYANTKKIKSATRHKPPVIGLRFTRSAAARFTRSSSKKSII